MSQGRTAPDGEPEPRERTGESGESGSGETGERDIDVRFSYANERTFLAWNRTALALITAGLAITQLLPPFDVPGGRRLIGLPLIALGVVLALDSLRQWRINEQAMRRRQPLPKSPLPRLLSGVIGAVALIALVLAAIGAKS